MNNQTIIVSTHVDFMGELDLITVQRYKRFVNENLSKLGYNDVWRPFSRREKPDKE